MSTAILFFSRRATAPAFGTDAARARRIGTALERRTLRTLRATGLPVLHYGAERQRGTTFGERLTHATREVFAVGYGNVLIVGNDCPTLRPEDLRAAARHLENGRPVLGPDRRGGAYLIGCSRERFTPADFLAIDWESPRVYAGLRALFGPATIRLGERADYNFVGELRAAWRTLRHLLRGLGEVLFGTAIPGTTYGFSLARKYRRAVVLRGPPAVMA